MNTNTSCCAELKKKTKQNDKIREVNQISNFLYRKIKTHFYEKGKTETTIEKN